MAQTADHLPVHGSSPRCVTVTMSDPQDRDAVSGGPARTVDELRQVWDDLAPVWPQGVSLTPRYASMLPGRVRHRVFHMEGLIRGVEHVSESMSRRIVLRKARSMSSAVDSRIAALAKAPSVLFGCFVCWPLFELRAPAPLVYYTDGTSKQINETYHNFRSRSKGFLRACIEIEGNVLRRASLIGVAAETTRKSVVDDYKIPSERVRLIPMGANVKPDAPLETTEPLDAPTKDHLRLILVASDVRRKRTDLAVDVVERLRQLGWNATLTLVGEPSERAQQSQAVECLGSLRLSSAADKVKHQSSLARAHLMILPSEAEAFGIAPAEAAHFGRPSIVSAAGGLPTVVQDGQTGIVMPIAATADQYAQAIIGLVSDVPRYRAVSAAALNRAHDVLTWEAWRRDVRQMMVDAIAMGPGRR